MEIKSRFAEKLSKILFLEIDKNKLSNIFNMKFKENVYMPIKSDNMIEKIKKGEKMETIPTPFFIEAMFYVMGADENFRFNNVYENILNTIPESIKYVKGKIFREVEEKNYEEAYIMLKGLIRIEKSTDNYEKIIILVNKLRNLDKSYRDEELGILEQAKKIDDFPMPYLYEAILNKEEGKFDDALFSLNNYLSKGGEETSDITELKCSLKSIDDYEKGKNLIYESPEEALKILLPLLDEFEDNAVLHYYIAIGYRNTENFEKAIYYLNEALRIDDSLVEVVNELGINYASLGDFKGAVKYLRKAFECTKSVEVCTNLIMCYMNSGNIEQAKNHLEIAKKLDPKDEIVVQLDGILNSKS